MWGSRYYSPYYYGGYGYASPGYSNYYYATPGYSSYYYDPSYYSGYSSSYYTPGYNSYYYRVPGPLSYRGVHCTSRCFVDRGIHYHDRGCQILLHPNDCGRPLSGRLCYLERISPEG